MLLIKSIVTPLLFPLPLCSLLIGIGLAILWFSRRERTGRILVTAGFAILMVLSYGALRPALRSLERVHPPIVEANITKAKWVVVLGGGSSSDSTLPITARANAPTLTRLVEGIRLSRQIPGSRLLLSGSAVFGSGSDAQVMSALAISLGVPPSSIVLDDESPDTETQALNVARITKGDPCILVTSALHMSRAMALFEKAGLTPDAAPAQHIAQGNIGLTPAVFYPSINGLATATLVENEYLGVAWAMLRGRI